MTFAAPQPLAGQHLVAKFDSGVASLDEWLKRRALGNQASGASRTFVVCEADRVIGYYALASGGVSVAAVPRRFRRNMPEPIPVVVLGRLAIARAHKGRVSAGRCSETVRSASFTRQKPSGFAAFWSMPFPMKQRRFTWPWVPSLRRSSP